MTQEDVDRIEREKHLDEQIKAKKAEEAAKPVAVPEPAEELPAPTVPADAPTE